MWNIGEDKHEDGFSRMSSNQRAALLKKAEANLHNDNSAQIPAPPHHSVNEQKLPQLESCRSLNGTGISRRFVREWIILAQATASPQETIVQVEMQTYDIAALKLKGRDKNMGGMTVHCDWPTRLPPTILRANFPCPCVRVSINVMSLHENLHHCVLRNPINRGTPGSTTMLNFHTESSVTYMSSPKSSLRETLVQVQMQIHYIEAIPIRLKVITKALTAGNRKFLIQVSEAICREAELTYAPKM
jgi:hypothetical protein